MIKLNKTNMIFSKKRDSKKSDGMKKDNDQKSEVKLFETMKKLR